MPEEYGQTIYRDGSPVAIINATALTDDGNDIVEAVREAVEEVSG